MGRSPAYWLEIDLSKSELKTIAKACDLDTKYCTGWSQRDWKKIDKYIRRAALDTARNKFRLLAKIDR